ncbi:hydantoin racemase [Klebsiella pneumoniae]|uniref:Hydantoin racemase n=1 Tax=Klebsiella pneumoniae TaxID=573 RepID=A0A377TVD8_KLEPN|nr:hydantoin racemase [Klebsiella pneumoniae]
MHMATMVATRFSIVTTLPRTLIIARHLLHQYGFHQHCAALHAIDLPVLALEDGSGLAQEKVRERCIRALKEDGSGAIVLGCGGMATLAQELTRELRVPVIDGVSAAVKMVESLVALGLATSKHGDLAFPEKKALSGQFQSLNPFKRGRRWERTRNTILAICEVMQGSRRTRAGRAGRGSRCSSSSTMRKARRITSCMAMRVRNSSCPILSAPPATRRAICRWIHSMSTAAGQGSGASIASSASAGCR